uniref:Uncharacterized protein n=1 Tax=Fibrocapsa japonica TaxID=94617 RepID=A0A7S2UUF6_9STRA|mmetsp:Transcript_10755/g.15951  ORF Transcript_10755/g.15951 Transcript_10755/m.15951 type:complete len:269 (+) Transcript_10755:223-1029(+)
MQLVFDTSFHLRLGVDSIGLLTFFSILQLVFKSSFGCAQTNDKNDSLKKDSGIVDAHYNELSDDDKDLLTLAGLRKPPVDDDAPGSTVASRRPPRNIKPPARYLDSVEMTKKKQSEKKKAKKKRQQDKKKLQKALFDDALMNSSHRVEEAPSSGAVSSPLLKVASLPPRTPLQDPDSSDEDGDDDFSIIELISTIIREKPRTVIGALKERFGAMEPKVRMSRAKRAMSQMKVEIERQSPTCRAIGHVNVAKLIDALEAWYWDTLNEGF